MFQVFIDDEEMVCESDFTIKEEFMNPSSIELYKVFPKSWKGTNKLLDEYYFPEDYSKCKILKDGELYFTGIVKNSADMVLNPFKPHYCSVQILDPSTLLSEGTTLEFVIVDKTVENAIKQVIDSIADYGFVAGTIEIPEKENTVIGTYSTLDKAPYDVFQYLAQISGTRWGTHMVDENTTAIDFYSPELLDNMGTIETNKEYYCTNKIDDITYNYSTTNYRNKQIITSDEVFANITSKETLISNGYDTTFTTEQKIGKISSITVNGDNKTFTTKDNKDLGITADFYYDTSSNELTSNVTYQAGTQINIEYTAIVQGREISYNTLEISRIKANLGRNGTISRYENRNDVASSSELQAVSKNYIKYNGNADITLTITARTDFLKLGGKYHFNAPLEKLTGNYLVKTKNTDICQNSGILQVKYTYELSNNYDTENEINYFDNQRNKTKGNISTEEYISRNIDVTNIANIIFDNLSVEEIEISDNNVLDCTLDSPFNN